MIKFQTALSLWTLLCMYIEELINSLSLVDINSYPKRKREQKLVPYKSNHQWKFQVWTKVKVLYLCNQTKPSNGSYYKSYHRKMIIDGNKQTHPSGQGFFGRHLSVDHWTSPLKRTLFFVFLFNVQWEERY